MSILSIKIVGIRHYRVLRYAMRSAISWSVNLAKDGIVSTGRMSCCLTFSTVAGRPLGQFFFFQKIFEAWAEFFIFFIGMVAGEAICVEKSSAVFWTLDDFKFHRIGFCRWRWIGVYCPYGVVSCRNAEDDKGKTEDQHAQNRNESKELFIEFDDGHLEQHDDDESRSQNSVDHGPQRGLIAYPGPISHAQEKKGEKKNEENAAANFVYFH
jgi:hypothetical protein